MRLLITTPNLETAGSRYIIRDLVRGLDRHRFTTTLAVHRITHNALEKELAPHLDAILELPLRISTRPPWRLWRQAHRLAAELHGRFDVAHSFDYSDVWSEGWIMRMARLPWVAEKTNMNWGNRRWFLRSWLATRLVCHSRVVAATLLAGSRFADKAAIIYNGIDPSLFTGTCEAEWFAAETGITAGSPVIGCIADLVPVKGHRQLLRAFRQVHEQIDAAHLVLIGGGEEEHTGELRRLCEELGINRRVHFLGRRSDVPRLLPCFDGLVLATRNWGRKEAFGVVLIEAMAAALPVVATRSGGPEEIVVDDETGWLVDAEGWQPLAHGMLELLADDARRRRFGAAGRERVEAHFTSRAMVRGYQDLYEEVVATHARARR